MKLTHSFRLPPAAVLPLLLLAAAPAEATPFTVHSLPSGFDMASFDNTAFSPGLRGSLGAADFDGDGHRDWYAGGSVISRFPRSGTINLPAMALPGSPSATVKPLAAALLDADGDGDCDIVRLNGWNGDSTAFTQQVFLNNGSGVFSAGHRIDWTSQPNWNTGARRYQMLPGDFDRDGDADLAILVTYQFPNYEVSPRRYEGSLHIRWNDGAQFNATTAVQTWHLSDAAELAAADIDQDGDIDFIVTGQLMVSGDGITTWAERRFLNHGNGTFTASSVASGVVIAHRLTDLDRDGWPDRLLHGNPMEWQRNNRAGGFHGTAVYPGAGGVPQDFCGADLNEDGRTDLLVAVGSELRMHPGSGSGTMGTAVVIATMPAPVRHVFADDIDRDGDTDVLASLTNGQWRMVENVAPALHPAWQSQFNCAVESPERLVAADMNRDGITDVLALSPASARVHFLQGNGNGTFAPSVFKLTVSQTPADLVAADLDRDGRMDFAYTLPAAGQVRRVLQTDGSFFSWLDTKVADLPGASALRCGNALGADGSPDLLAASGTTGQVRWFINDGSAAAWSGHTVVNSHTPAVQGLLTAPFMGALGDMPFLTAAAPSPPSALEVRGYQYLGVGSPPWTTVHHQLSEQTAAPSRALALARVDGDSKPELVFATGNGDLVWWKPTATPGNTGTLIDASPSGIIHDIAVVDWNRDGRDDILCATSGGIDLHVRSATGWVRFAMVSGGSFTSVAAIDLNRDGLTDAVAAEPGQDCVVRVLNTSSTTPPTPLQQWRQIHFGAADGSGTAANHADWDRDGVANIVEYVTGTDPTTAEPVVNGARGLTLDASGGPDAFATARIWLSSQALDDPGIRLTIERSSNLTAWTTLAARTGTGSWTITSPGIFTIGGLTRHIFTLPVKPATTPRHWLRLRVEELP